MDSRKIRHKSLLHQISSQLSAEDLGSLKFLCTGMITPRRLEGVTSPLHLWDALEEVSQLSPGDYQCVADLCKEINRLDLANLFLEQSNLQTSGLNKSREDKSSRILLECQAESDKIRNGRRALPLCVEEAFVSHIGRDWRRLGRVMGFTDALLDGIREAYPHSLREQGASLLSAWVTREGTDDVALTINKLVDQLKHAKLNRLAANISNEGFKANTIVSSV